MGSSVSDVRYRGASVRALNSPEDIADGCFKFVAITGRQFSVNDRQIRRMWESEANPGCTIMEYIGAGVIAQVVAAHPLVEILAVLREHRAAHE